MANGGKTGGCPGCGGPLSKVRMPVGPLNRPAEQDEVWRCLVCGSDYIAQREPYRAVPATLQPRSLWSQAG